MPGSIRGQGVSVKRIVHCGIFVIATLAGTPTQGQAEASPVYFGEIESKSDEAITLNVTPCQSTKTLQKVSPYEITDLAKVSCGDGGREYTRVTVKQKQKSGTKKPDKDKPKDEPKPEDQNKPDEPEKQPSRNHHI